MPRRTRSSLHLAAAGFLALLPLFPPPVSADETAVVAGQTWTYTLDDAGNATLTSGPKSGTLSIPASLGSHPVTAIGGGAFSRCTNIVSVALPDTITNIATEAFIGCNGLSTVALPDSVETLGYRSFAYCYGLVSFFAGTGLRHIGEDAFQDCTALEECILSEGIETIDKMAFSYCSALPSLDLPASVANIASDAFNGSTSLARFGVAPGNPAFAECDGVLFSGDMQSLLHFPPAKTGPYTIPNGVKTIGELAFMGCQGIDWGPFPDSLETIEDFAFIYGNASSSMVLPDGLRSIGRRAFYFFSNLVELSIGSATTNISSGAFECASELLRFDVAPDNPCYTAIDGILYSKDAKTLVCCPAGRTETIEVPPGVTTIAPGAFYYCKELRAVTLPAGITDIGDQAFDQCRSLASLSLPEGLERIGAWAFFYCDSLTALDLPSSVVSIGDTAFCNCFALASLSIPPGLTRIEAQTFSWCKSLAAIDIPQNVTYIGNEAFYQCDALTSLSLPDTLKEIGPGAFCHCANLAAINLGTGVTNIGNSAFFDCYSLPWLYLPDSVENIGIYAFSNCGNLKTLFVPAAWQGTSILDGTALPRGCTVVYRPAPGTPGALYSDWLAHFGKTAEELPPDDDTDGDGATNHDEFAADTNPLDPADRLRAVIHIVDGKWHIEPSPFRSNRTYQVLSTPALSATNPPAAWSPSPSVLTAPLPPSQFFLLSVSAPE